MMEMSEAAKKCRAEYYRKYRAEHPETIRAANARYYAKTHPAKKKEPKICKYCTLDDDWKLPSKGPKDGLWVYLGIDKTAAAIGVNYGMFEIEHFKFPIKFCPYCGKKLTAEGT